MRYARRIPFLLFVVCFVTVALPVSAGQLGARKLIWTAFCGDGVLAPKEECDPGIPGAFEPNLGGKTCASEGYSEGDLACTAACKLDRSGCVCGSSGPPAAVAKTGQTACYDESSQTIECPGSGQDGEYQKGVSVDPRFTDNLDGTVADNLTGLIWLQDPTCLGYHPWLAALDVANNLASGTCGLVDGSVAGDWRLPNVKELLSLIDYGHRSPALPPGHPFTGVMNQTYWTSTTSVSYTAALRPEFANAWWVSLSYGDAFGGNLNKGYNAYVWPVRGGQ